MTRPTLLLMLAVSGVPAVTQSPAPSRLQSPEVHPDQRVTFRVRAPGAQAVTVVREGAAPLPMQKNAEGVWSATSDRLEPDFYGYTFNVDGARVLDSANALMKPNLLNPASLLHVPGPATLPWEVNDVAHGTVHRHYYKSAVVGDQRDYFVYTPPGYDPSGAARYPVLYLLHGMSDAADAWSSDVGRAHVILDNLIARGQAKPMIVVMPLGYGAPEILTPLPPGATRDPALSQRNRDKFRDALLSEVLPQVETLYRAARDRNSRAIAGLSMGGAQSLATGLNALDRFAWIGAFSSGGLTANFDAAFPALDGRANRELRLLWIACGTDDSLITINRSLHDWLTSKGVHHENVETAGAHTWMVWRRNLAAFAPQLFRPVDKTLDWASAESSFLVKGRHGFQ